MARSKRVGSRTKPNSSPHYTPERAKARIAEQIHRSRLLQGKVKTVRKKPRSILVEYNEKYKPYQWTDKNIERVENALRFAAPVMGLHEKHSTKNLQRRNDREVTTFFYDYDPRTEYEYWGNRGHRIVSHKRDQHQTVERRRFTDKKGKPVFEIVDVFNVYEDGKHKSWPSPQSIIRFYAHPAAVILAELIRNPPSNAEAIRTFVLRKVGAPIARDVVESTPDIATHEMAWKRRKGKPGEMKPIAKIRTTENVTLSAIKNARSVIHTHPGNHVFPSSIDIGRFIHSIKNGTKFEHVFVVSSKTGKELGRITLKATPKLRRAIRQNTPIIRTVMERENSPYGPFGFFDFEALMREGMRIRVKPAAGYMFEEGFFVRPRARYIHRQN